jgi:hypothetical protein
MSTSTPASGGGSGPTPHAPSLSDGGVDDHDNSLPLVDSPLVEDLLERLSDLRVQMVVPSFSAGPSATPLSPPPEQPAAESHGGGSANDHDHGNNNTSSPPPLLDLLERFPDLFEKYVLEHLDPTARAELARTGSPFRDVVFPRSIFPFGLPARAETTGGSVRVFNLVDFLGSAERLAWAKANGCPWDAVTCQYAAWGGHLVALKFARQHGCPWDARTCHFAARGGHLEVLRWAREHQCPWGSGTCALAARQGHLAVLRWAREHGCPWDSQTCERAAGGGHLAVLQWAREHGCPWNNGNAVRARRSGRTPGVLQWARAHGCRWNKWQCEYASHNHPETLAWVRQQPA